MKQLNRDNYLIWQHQFNQVVANNIAVDDAKNISISDILTHVSPLTNDTSTLGINASSLVITQQAVPSNPAVWDYLSQRIIFFMPSAYVAPGTVFTLKYKWADISGNLSNEALIRITVVDRAWSWRAYAASAYCITAGGVNTGDLAYGQLEKYYTHDNTPYFPATLRANIVGDPYYVAPAQNLATCPLPSANTSFYLFNGLEKFTIQTIRLGSANPDLIVNFESTDPQPNQLAVASGFYDEVRITILNIGIRRTIPVNLATSFDGPENIDSDCFTNIPKTITFLNKTFDSAFGGQLQI